MVLVMGLVGLIASAILVATYEITAPYIEANRAAALERAIFDVLKDAVSRSVFAVNEDGSVEQVDEAAPGTQPIYAGYDATGALVGLAFQGSGQGFQDVLSILIGYRPDCQCVVGMKVLESKETPGLGDKIEKDEAFQENLAHLDVRLREDGSGLAHPVELVKGGQKTNDWQVEGITGATISSRAVVRIIDANAAELIPIIERNLETFRKSDE
jgi:electron transport complex protein RnfG